MKEMTEIVLRAQAPTQATLNSVLTMLPTMIGTAVRPVHHKIWVLGT
jgi:hypothetical protein